jgi:hypothetical protein
MEQIKSTQRASNFNVLFSVILLMIFLLLFGKTVKSQVVVNYVDSAGVAGYNGDGFNARNGRINIPFGSYGGNIAIDNNGDLFIADFLNHRIRKVDKTTQVITTVVGNGIGAYSGDGGLAVNAQVYRPACIAFDAANNMYISDQSNYRIRKVDAVTGIITTFAGTGAFGVPGPNGDNGLAINCAFRTLSHITIDGYGNLYVVDLYRIRKISAGTNIITAFAGNDNYGFSNDIPVPATSTYFGGVLGGILADNVGNVYIASGLRVRKVQGGIISTVIGHYWDNGQIFGGDGGLATSNTYYGATSNLAWGIYGELYLCEQSNNLIRKYNPSTGIITTVVGDVAGGYPFLYGGYNGENHYPLATKLHYPSSVAVNASGEMFILDENRVRKVYYPCTPITVSRSVTVCASALPYHWAGLTLTATGNYTVHQTLASGCDSSATLRLTVLGTMPPITGPNNVCIGSTIQLSDSFIGGTWTSIVGRATVSNTGLVTGISADVATIKYSFVNELGCNATSTYFVSVNPIPNVPTIQYAPGTVDPQSGAPRGSFCANRTFTVVGIPSGGLWSTTGNVSVGSTTGIVTIGSTVGPGTITYRYTTPFGCSNSRTMVGSVFICASGRGVNTVDSQPLTVDCFTIYPNPAKNAVSIQVDKSITDGQIIVTDLYGKTLKSQSLSIGKNSIDVSSFSKGLYFVNIITNQNRQTQKLIIE